MAHHSGILISYRRSDSPGHAGRLFDHLHERFGDRVFMDVDHLKPGVDFGAEIKAAIRHCSTMVVVIGPGWLSAHDDAGQRRLDNTDDLLRLEVATALGAGVTVIPALVDGATMPEEDELPPDLAALASRNAIELSETRWSYDVDRLIEATGEPVIAKLSSTRAGWFNARRPVLLLCSLVAVLGTGVAARSCGEGSVPAEPKLREFGADQCVEKYVWREAVDTATEVDHVCVLMHERAQAAADNAAAAERRLDPTNVHSPCIAGYVWRFATATDYVCVTLETWRQTQLDNAAAASRVQR